MDLRSITIGLPLENLLELSNLEERLHQFIDYLKIELSKKNISLRTIRINLSQINESSISNLDQQQELLGKIQLVSKLCDNLDIRWFNVPFNLVNATNPSVMTDFALEILKRFPKTFINLIVSENNKINYTAIKSSSKFIKDVSRLSNSGYDNFRVGVSCNVKPNTPFFPFTFSSNTLGFSIALELTKEFIKLINPDTLDLNLIRQRILDKLTPEIKEIESICKNSEAQNLIKFHGVDVSLAPYPEKNSSVAFLLEKLGLDKQGSNGTLFLTSYLTDILRNFIKKGDLRTAGFNGVMFSLLEDEFMGKRNNNNIFSIDSLISYSAVCGCGLDMVPLPGDIFEEELSSITLDIAALSSVLNKPLGLRVLPIPMKQENEFTEFNMDFLFNTRIKKIKHLAFDGKYFNNKNISYLNKGNNTNNNNHEKYNPERRKGVFGHMDNNQKEKFQGL